MRVSIKRYPDDLGSLMEDDRVRNAWVKSGSLAFYVRKGHICLHQDGASFFKPCLMVANFGVRTSAARTSMRRAYQMIGFMEEIEASALEFGYAGVFVECVYNRRLHPLLSRFSYKRLHDRDYSAPCYFKSASSILSKSANQQLKLRFLQRPSLRRFLQTPDVGRYWLRDQRENLILSVRRERLGTLLTPCMRLTILEVYRYKAMLGTQHDHKLYWPDDTSLIACYLRKLEARIAAEGFHELALSPIAIDTAVRTDYGGRTSEGAGRTARDRKMLALGFRILSELGSAGTFVKKILPRPLKYKCRENDARQVMAFS